MNPQQSQENKILVALELIWCSRNSDHTEARTNLTSRSLSLTQPSRDPQTHTRTTARRPTSPEPTEPAEPRDQSLGGAHRTPRVTPRAAPRYRLVPRAQLRTLGHEIRKVIEKTTSSKLPPLSCCVRVRGPARRGRESDRPRKTPNHPQRTRSCRLPLPERLPAPARKKYRYSTEPLKHTRTTDLQYCKNNVRSVASSWST